MVLGDAKESESRTNPYQFTELEQSALRETVNIMGGSCLTAIMEFTGLSVSPSVPYLCTDMIGALLNVAAGEVGTVGDFALMFQSQLYNAKERIIGDLLLIPEENSCDIIMRALGLEE